MTNREYLLNKMQNMSDEDIVQEICLYEYVCKLKACKDINCGSSKCREKLIAWLKQEHKEKITLSEAERIILENIDEEFVAIGKNMSGEMFFLKKNGDKYWSSIFNAGMFKFIKEDYEPYNIEELLKEE